MQQGSKALSEAINARKASSEAINDMTPAGGSASPAATEATKYYHCTTKFQMQFFVHNSSVRLTTVHLSTSDLVAGNSDSRLR